MATKKYTIRIREEGRGRPMLEDFTNLDAAREFIRERWMGADYIDSNIEFHTDYSTYELVNFSLNDIGTFTYDEGFREYRFNDDEPARQTRPDDNGDYCSTFYLQSGR